MALKVTAEERLAAAVAYLRETGHEDEARAVEELLTKRSGRRRGASRLVGESISVADAAEQLGEAPAQVRRCIELGMLAGVGDNQAGYQFVTRESLDELLEARRLLAIVAEPLPGESTADADERTLLAQMLTDAAELDQAERA